MYKLKTSKQMIFSGKLTSTILLSQKKVKSETTWKKKNFLYQVITFQWASF